jgi:hypothetical protein
MNHGYYQVGNQAYVNKVEAILKAEATNQFPYFIFHDEEYSKFDWTAEPDQTLQQLYAARAWELRNKYDHLVLHFSGGSDSTNILETFIRNDIKLDEVLIRGPSEAAKRNKLDHSSLNLFAENYLNAYPLAEYVKSTYMPDLKITAVDTTKYTIDWWAKNPDWHEHNSFSIFGPSIAWRSDYLDIERDLLRTADSGKKVAHIVGIDKPTLVYNNGEYKVKFLDNIRNNLLNIRLNRQDVEYNLEAFYWAEGCAPMIIKQAHAVKNYIKQNQLSPDVLNKKGRAQHEWYGSIIYNRTLPVYFQSEKDGFGTFSLDGFFHEDKNSDHVKNYQRGIDVLNQRIPEKWKVTGSSILQLVGIWSREYNIGF